MLKAFLLKFVCICVVVWFPFGAAGATVVKLGTVTQITGPQDLDLEGDFVYAINFSADDPPRTVRGVTFQPDRLGIPGATLVGPQQVTSWETKPEMGTSADATQLEEILHDIRWANAGSNERVRATLKVNPGDEYKLQILISGNRVEDRRWDIRVNGAQAVDEITSLGVAPGQSYSQKRATLYTYQFTSTSTNLVVEMGNLFGLNDGGDRNPIWQALTLERVTIPPTPDDIVLDSTLFFANQTQRVATLRAVDQKFNASHRFELSAGPGDTDNSKFAVSGNELRPAFDFGTFPPGSTFSVRIRATDLQDATRFLEKNFTLTIVEAHPPTSIQLDVSSINALAQSGARIARITVADPDTADRHVLTLVEGAVDNSLFTVAADEIRLLNGLPAGLNEVHLRVKAVDLSNKTVESTFVLSLAAPQLELSELIANYSPAGGETIDPEDFIEIHNRLSQWVELPGWYLSDSKSAPQRWTFPAGRIAPNGFFVVIADGLGVAPEGSTNLHANFSLSSSGEWVGLTAPDRTLASALTAPEFFPNVAFGIGQDGRMGHLQTPTLGRPNGPVAEFGVNEVVFSKPHGNYTQAFNLELSATVPDSVIRYTTDGTLPTATSGVVYSSPILVAPNTTGTTRGVRIIRALAVNSKAAYARSAAQTYLFVNGRTAPTVDGVVSQSALVNSIRNHPVYGPLLDDALLALPTVSVLLPSGPNGTERFASVELFDPDPGKEEGFQINCGINATGTTSLASPKLSMAAKFRPKYGRSKLKYPVFARGSMVPEGAATEFKELRLRSHSHDTFYWLAMRENPAVPYGSPPVTRGGDAQLGRNVWIDEIQLLMDQPGKHGRQVHLYLNGAYHGIYHVHEHPDEDFMATYYPGSSGDFHSTAAGIAGSDHGGGDTWRVTWNALKASLGNYRQAQRWVDVTNLCDYMALSFYAGNDWDWTAQHNWSAAGPAAIDRGGWKFFEQDSDVCLQDINADCTDQDVPDGIFTALMRHADFRVLFRDRVYKHCFHGGVLARAGDIYDRVMNDISVAIIAETARWQPSSSVSPLPWDRDQEWKNEWNYLRNTFFPQRVQRLISQLKKHPGWWPVDPPVLNQYGGNVPVGFNLNLSSTLGTVYYTLDGSDPRLPGGSANPLAIRATGSSPLIVNSPLLVNARVFSGGEWSALVQAYLVPANVPPASAENLVLCEIHYRPKDEPNNEFLEFLNTGSSSIDLSDVKISGAVSFVFPKASVLAAGDRVVVAKDLALFSARYQTNTSPYYREVRVVGPWEGSLSNDGEEIVISRPDGARMFGCTYGNSGGWPGRADGKGSSLELINPIRVPLSTDEKSAWLSNPFNWRPSAEFDGSPGAAGSGPDNRVVINEVLPAPALGISELIELKNVTEAELDLSGWFLSDSSANYRKYRFPEGSVIAAGGYRVLLEQDFKNTNNPACLLPFALDNSGEDIYLVEAQRDGAIMRFVDHAEYPPAPLGSVFGRWPDGTGPLLLLRTGTPGDRNGLPVEGYAAWASVSFPLGTPASLTEPSADPDGDGLSNQAEYAFVTSPLKPNASSLALAEAPQSDLLAFTFRQRTSASELTYTVEVSTDFSSWDRSGRDVEIVSSTPQLDGSTAVLARLRPNAAQARRFVRVVVTP